MKLSQWIREEKAAGRYWTMAIVAKRVGLHPGSLSKMVNGYTEARVGPVRKIAELTKGKVGLTDWPDVTRHAGD